MMATTLLLALTAISCGCFCSIDALATIRTEQDRGTVSEGESLEVCVTLDPLQDVTVELQITTFSNRVLEGTDFDLSRDTIPFTVGGESEQCVDFIAHEDNAVESGEPVRVILGGVVVGSPNELLITIVDTSRINVSFTSESYRIGEDGGAVSVCATIVGGTIERIVSVVIQSEDVGTASPTGDYLASGVVTKSFKDNMPNEPVCTNIPIQEDAIIEEDETFLVRLIPGLDAVNVVMDTATVFITDNDGASLSVFQSSTQLSEGDSGLTEVNVGLVVTLNTNTLDRDIPILANTVDVVATAANNDFIPLVNAPFSIPSTIGDGETFTFTAHIVGDIVMEDTELFRIEFTAANPNDVFGNNRIFVRILNDQDVVRDCDGLDDPTNGQVTISPDTLEDSIATYSCELGYDRNGMETRTCLNSGWEGEAATCQIVNCGPLEEPVRGSIMISMTDYEGRAIYSCDSGYELETGTPTITRTCELNGMWSGDVPQCVRISCEFLPEPDNGLIRYPNGGTLFGDAAQYECNPGYNLDGTPERTCQADREWTLTAPTCQPVNCGELSNPSNGLVTLTSNFFPGMASYNCSTNFELVNGPEERACQPNGTWSESAPTCQVIQCVTLLDPENGMVNIQVDIDGETTATYSCNEGHDLIGSSARMCQTNRQWSGTEATCNIVVCSNQTAPINGAVSLNSTTFESEAVYECDIGYTLRGTSIVVCQSNGMWSSGLPFCDIVRCPVLASPDDGSVSFSELVFSSMATYTCNSGFIISGPATRMCEESGDWSGEDPSCLFVVEVPSCPELDIFNSTINTTVGIYRHIGSVVNVECNENYTLVGEESLLCDNETMWSADIPSCVLACPNITVVGGDLDYTNETLPGSVATVTCDNGLSRTGPDSRNCMEDGMWSEDENTCTSGPTTGGISTTLATTTIIGIAVGGAAFVIILIIIVVISVLICYGIRKKQIYQKYVLPYRSYIYANDSQRNSSGGPLSDTEIRQWESQTRQHAVDAVDALEKT